MVIKLTCQPLLDADARRDVTSECPIEGQEFQECRTCPATCDDPDLLCTLQCQPGCGCPPGELIDEENNSCVKPGKCPIETCKCKYYVANALYTSVCRLPTLVLQTTNTGGGEKAWE